MASVREPLTWDDALEPTLDWNRFSHHEPDFELDQRVAS
jgi:hypothetical protein